MGKKTPNPQNNTFHTKIFVFLLQKESLCYPFIVRGDNASTPLKGQVSVFRAQRGEDQRGGEQWLCYVQSQSPTSIIA